MRTAQTRGAGTGGHWLRVLLLVLLVCGLAPPSGAGTPRPAPTHAADCAAHRDTAHRHAVPHADLCCLFHCAPAVPALGLGTEPPQARFFRYARGADRRLSPSVRQVPVPPPRRA